MLYNVLINKVTLFVILVNLKVIFCIDTEENVENIEADYGKSVILHCKSNDDFHNFMFWHLSKTGVTIGPKNVFDNNKFKYEILSGNLTVYGVTKNDVGRYMCVSDGVNQRDVAIHSVNLVLKNWKEKEPHKNYVANNNNSDNGNLWKVSAILGSIFVFLVIILVALHVYHKETEKPNYFEQNDEDEDSTEELFTREPSTSGVRATNNKNGVSDNFKKVYTAIKVNNT